MASWLVVFQGRYLAREEVLSEHDAQGTPPHHGFSLLISAEFGCVEHYT